MRKGVSHYNNLRKDPITLDGTTQAVKNEFARRLESRRIERGWNQSELARAASLQLPKAKPRERQKKIGRDLISHYSRGLMLPRPEYLAAIAKALSCEPGDLMPERGVPSVVPTSVELRAVDTDRAQLRINRTVSLGLATQIVALIAAEDRGAAS